MAHLGFDLLEGRPVRIERLMVRITRHRRDYPTQAEVLRTAADRAWVGYPVIHLYVVCVTRHFVVNLFL